MIQGLFLDRIHGNRSRTPITELRQSSGFVLTNEAEAVLALTDVAMPGAEVAVEAPIGHGLPPLGIVN